MRFAVLADVHGNADALAAVLQDIRAQSPDAIINLGDCYSGPLDIGRTAELLAEADIAVTVRGNHDRWLLSPVEGDDWDEITRPQLAAETLAWLAKLPENAVLDDLFACHATPRDDLTGWLEVTLTDGSRGRAGLDHITRFAEGVSQPVMLCGHTHVARTLRLADGRLIVNPGTVGCPGFLATAASPSRPVCTGTPHASYAILDRVGLGWAVAHRLVPYDSARMVAMAAAAGYPDWVSALSSGWI
jgi:predicted phosphodiesterase